MRVFVVSAVAHAEVQGCSVWVGVLCVSDPIWVDAWNGVWVDVVNGVGDIVFMADV